jgi:hypothetical protein
MSHTKYQPKLGESWSIESLVRLTFSAAGFVVVKAIIIFIQVSSATRCLVEDTGFLQTNMQSECAEDSPFLASVFSSVPR